MKMQLESPPREAATGDEPRGFTSGGVKTAVLAAYSMQMPFGDKPPKSMPPAERPGRPQPRPPEPHMPPGDRPGPERRQPDPMPEGDRPGRPLPPVRDGAAAARPRD